MRILHVGLVGPFNDDMAYQGSILPKENKKAGHEVIVITSCYKWSENQVIKVPEEDRIKDGIRYIRIEYDRIIFLRKSVLQRRRSLKPGMISIVEIVK